MPVRPLSIQLAAWLSATLALGCASAPPPPFKPRPDGEIATFPRAIVEPSPTRPEGISQGVAVAVTLRAGIDQTGAVRTVRVLKSADRIFDQEAMDSMMRARFRPALDASGQPVDCEITWVLRFDSR